MDPVALAELTRGTGPISAPGLDLEVGPDNAVQTFLYDSYIEFPDTAEQNVYLAGLVDAFWKRIGSGKVDAQGFAAGLSTAVNSGHFKAYSEDSAAQVALGRLAATGDYTAYGDNVQLIYANNAAPNKADFFMHRTIDTKVVLGDDGSALVTTRVTFENRVPSDAPPSLVAGPGIEGDQKGLNAMALFALLPEGSQLRTFTIDGQRSAALQGREGDYPVVWDLVEVPAEETSEVEIIYRIPHLYDPAQGVVDLTLYPQAVVGQPDPFNLVIQAPDGDELLTPTLTRPAGSFSTAGFLEGPLRLSFRLVR